MRYNVLCDKDIGDVVAGVTDDDDNVLCTSSDSEESERSKYAWGVLGSQLYDVTVRICLSFCMKVRTVCEAFVHCVRGISMIYSDRVGDAVSAESQSRQGASG